MVDIKLEDNGTKGQFVIYENGIRAGEMTYTWADQNKFIIDHTSVEDNFGGKGYGKMMVLKAVDYAREKEVDIIPLCPFVKAEFDKNDNFHL